MKHCRKLFPALLTILLAAACSSDRPASMPDHAEVGDSRPHSAEDVQALLQSVIDAPAMQIYYHPEIPGRRPLLMMVNEHLQQQPPLEKFSLPVVYLSPAELKGDPQAAYLELIGLSIGDQSALVEFRYRAEGLLGKAAFRRSGNTWVLGPLRLVEQ